MRRSFALILILATCAFAVEAIDASGLRGGVGRLFESAAIMQSLGIPISAEYVVFQNDSRDSAFVGNFKDGTIDTAGVDQSAVIQYALNRGGKIIIKGTYLEMDSLIVHSNTVIELTDSTFIQLRDSVRGAVFCVDSSLHESNIEIYGGEVCGNVQRAGMVAYADCPTAGTTTYGYDSTYGTCGLSFINVTNLSIHGMTIHGGHVQGTGGTCWTTQDLNTGQGVLLMYCNNVWMYGCAVDSARYNQLLIYGGANVNVWGCTFDGRSKQALGTNTTVQQAACTQTMISGCDIYAYYCGNRIAHTGSGRNFFTGNNVYGDSTYSSGVQIMISCNDNFVTGNVFYCARKGISFPYAGKSKRNTISDNAFYGIQSALYFDGLAADSNVFIENKIMSRYINHSAPYELFHVDSGNVGNVIKNNYVHYRCDSIPVFWDAGTGTQHDSVFSPYVYLDTMSFRIDSLLIEDMTLGSYSNKYVGYDTSAGYVGGTADYLYMRQQNSASYASLLRVNCDTMGIVSIDSFRVFLYCQQIGTADTAFMWAYPTRWCEANASYLYGPILDCNTATPGTWPDLSGTTWNIFSMTATALDTAQVFSANAWYSWLSASGVGYRPRYKDISVVLTLKGALGQWSRFYSCESTNSNRPYCLVYGKVLKRRP